MNLLERGAIKRAHKQLGPAMESGERILDFDIGHNHLGEQVQVIATTHALYVVHRGGNVPRYPYRDWVSIACRADPPIVSFGTFSGHEELFQFGRSRRGLPAVVADQAGPFVDRNR